MKLWVIRTRSKVQPFRVRKKEAPVKFWRPQRTINQLTNVTRGKEWRLPPILLRRPCEVRAKRSHGQFRPKTTECQLKLMPVSGMKLNERTYFGYFKRYSIEQPYQWRALDETFSLMWLGLFSKITKLRSPPVSP